MTPSTLSLLMVLMLAGCSRSMPCSETSKAAAPEALMTAGTATPFLVLATSSTEPIPACHHCPVAPPKIEKHRRHKKHWPSDAAQMPLIVPNDPQPAMMTPQQFTNFMDENLTVSDECTPSYTRDGILYAGSCPFHKTTPCSPELEGAIANITDSTTEKFGDVIAGGGSHFVQGYCDSRHWSVMAVPSHAASDKARKYPPDYKMPKGS